MKKLRIFNIKEFALFRNSKFEFRIFFKRGFSLVEAIIGTALILLSLTSLTAAYSFYLHAGLKNTDRLKAVFLLQEGVEATVLIRDNSWNSLTALTSGTPYHLLWNGAGWTGTTTPVLIDSALYRTFTIEDVYRRNSDKDIVPVTSGDPKSLDSGTKKITVRVFMVNGATTTLNASVMTYLANLFE